MRKCQQVKWTSETKLFTSLFAYIHVCFNRQTYIHAPSKHVCKLASTHKTNIDVYMYIWYACVHSWILRPKLIGRCQQPATSDGDMNHADSLAVVLPVDGGSLENRSSPTEGPKGAPRKQPWQQTRQPQQQQLLQQQQQPTTTTTTTTTTTRTTNRQQPPPTTTSAKT